MRSLLRLGVAERRARLGWRHHLHRPAARVEAVAGDLVGLHSSDPATVFLSARARVAGLPVAELEDALYERRTLARVLGMRRTMFVVPPDLAAVVDAACTRALAPRERSRLVRMLEEHAIDPDAAGWLGRVERSTLDALGARGHATATELVADVPELARKLTFGAGTASEAAVGLSTRVLFLLATDGRIVRGRPLGSWLSSQWRWASAHEWLGLLPALDPAAARAELVRRWLASYGPGTARDVSWWAGWGLRDTTAALRQVGAVEVALDGDTGYVLPDDVDAVSEPGPWVALLPALDSTVMGWKERAWYLGEHGAALFDRNGNAGPTVWVDGRVVGGWAQTPDGEVSVALLEAVGAEAQAMVAAEAARLAEWLGDARVRPRFRTPLEQQLAGAPAPRRGSAVSS
jgi:hypothetical protein